MNVLVFLSTTVAALGGLLLGFDTAVIAGTTHGIRTAFALTPATLGITVSFALWGTVGGGLLAAPFAERYGIRQGLRLMAVLYLVSALGCALAQDWPSFLTFRFIGGLGIGGSSVLSPMYIADIAPRRWRGRMVACFQLAAVSGILTAYASNWIISSMAARSSTWRYELGAAGLPALLFLFALFFIPESPRWLLAHGAPEQARAVFRRIDSGDEAEAATATTATGQHQLFTRQHRRLILIALSIGVLNQLSGINAILYYLNDIFAQAGFSATSANVQAVIIGAANLLFTVVAMLLIDTKGRRFLLFVGSGGMVVCLLAIAALFILPVPKAALLWLLIAYIAFFAVSQGTVVWVYLSELFPPGIREKGQSLGTLSLWLTNGVVAAVYPAVASVAGQYPFLFFAVMMAAQLALTAFVYPETKGVSLEQASDLVAAQRPAPS